MPYFKPVPSYLRPASAMVPVGGLMANRMKSYIASRPSATFRSGRSSVSSYSRRSRKKVKSFKELVKATEPARHYSFETNAALLHNTLYECVPTQGPTQGDSNINRTGDSIYLCALKVQGVFQSASAANFYSLRLLVGWTGEEVTTVGASSSFVSALGVGDVFLPGTATLATVNGIVNPKAFTCLYDTTIDSNSQIVATVDGQSFNFMVPLNQSYYYQSSGSIQGKTKNLVVFVIGNVASGVTGTTPAGNFVTSVDLIFKD